MSRELPPTLRGDRQTLRPASAGADGGTLDEDTYRAAEAELATARVTLQTTDPQDVGAVTLALKKVRRLLGDVAALSTEVTIVIALVQGLS